MGRFTGKYKNLNPKLLKEIEKILDSIGMEKLEVTSGMRTREDIPRILREENILNRSFDLRDWSKSSKPVIKSASNIRPLSDFEEYPEAFSVLSDAVLRLGKYSNTVNGKKTKGSGISEAYKEIDRLDLPSNLKNQMKESLAAVRQNFGGFDSSHMEGAKLDTSLAAFERVIGNRRQALQKFREFKDKVRSNPNLHLNDEVSNNNVADVALVRTPKPTKDYGEQFGPSDEELKVGNIDRPVKLNSKKEKDINEGLSYKELFEKKMEEKGEGEVFDYYNPKTGKVEKHLLKRAEPKEDKLQKLETIKKQLKPVEDDMPTEEDMNFVPEEERADIFDDFKPIEDPREMQLQRLIKRGEDLVNKYDKFKDGGRKYQDGSMYGPSDEELMGNKKSFEELAREYASLKVPENVPTPEEMNPQVEETPTVDEKEQFVESPMDKSGEYESYKKGLAEGQNKPSGTETEPLTMDKLESEYRKLMEASKEERKTAQWATAATQIASMLDKFSARPVGIKPINFQAQVNPPEVKDLMNLGRMKGLDNQNQQMTPAERARLELAQEKLKEIKEDRKRKKTQFEQSQKLREEIFKRKIEEGDRLSDKQVERVESLKFARDLTDRIEEQLPKVEEFLGPYASRIESASSFIPGMEQDPKFVAFKANAVEQLASYIKDKSGAQVSDNERRFLEGALPSVTDKPGEFKSKLKEFKRRLDMVRDGRLGTIKAQGKDIKEFKEMLNEDKVDYSNITEEDIKKMSIEELKKAGLL